jgi:hypothetical protein
VTILLAALFADAPDPLSALLNAGAAGVVALVLYLLHRDSLKAFREELAAEREVFRAEMAAERASGRQVWRRLILMSDRQHRQNTDHLGRQDEQIANQAQQLCRIEVGVGELLGRAPAKPNAITR